jgi:polyribonucleotide nucleotidyltransferase
VNKVEDVLNIGDQVLVRVFEIDPKTGKIGLTRKDLLPETKKDADNGEN